MEKNLSSSFQKLREEKVLFDVTLGVESIKFQAHKVGQFFCNEDALYWLQYCIYDNTVICSSFAELKLFLFGFTNASSIYNLIFLSFWEMQIGNAKTAL